MKRRDFIASTGAGLVTILLGSCRFTSKEELQQPSTQLAAADSNNGGSKKVQIAVITGSPHKNGTSALLAGKFIEGAKTAGHELFRFNAAFEDIHPCLGCDRCA